MKKFIIPVAVALTVALAMSSCEVHDMAHDRPSTETISTDRRYYVDDASHSITLITFKGHEYLIYDGIESGSMCHSETCPCKSK